jgi:hypothetical protein
MVQPVETAAGLTAEDAALIAQGAALDVESTPPPVDAATGQPIVPTDYGTEAAMLISTLVLVAAPFFPSIPKIWAQPKQQAVAAALAPVMEKYGFTLGDFMGAYKEEITLIVVAGPLVLETIDGIKADRAASRKPAPAATPTGETQTTSAAPLDLGGEPGQA